VCGIVLFRTVIVMFVVVLVVDTYCTSVVSVTPIVPVPMWMCGPPTIHFFLLNPASSLSETEVCYIYC
jgi:hypothetical protein